MRVRKMTRGKIDRVKLLEERSTMYGVLKDSGNKWAVC